MTVLGAAGAVAMDIGLLMDRHHIMKARGNRLALSIRLRRRKGLQTLRINADRLCVLSETKASLLPAPINTAVL